jgi:hypothetical protein
MSDRFYFYLGIGLIAINTPPAIVNAYNGYVLGLVCSLLGLFCGWVLAIATYPGD